MILFYSVFRLTVITVLKSNRKIIERGKIVTPKHTNTCIAEFVNIVGPDRQNFIRSGI